jgi:hypothetical protein
MSIVLVAIIGFEKGSEERGTADGFNQRIKESRAYSYKDGSCCHYSTRIRIRMMAGWWKMK